MTYEDIKNALEDLFDGKGKHGVIYVLMTFTLNQYISPARETA